MVTSERESVGRGFWLQWVLAVALGLAMALFEFEEELAPLVAGVAV